MSNITIIANCQAQSLDLLIRHMVPTAVVFSVDFLSPLSLDQATQQETLSHLSAADFIIMQTGGAGIYDAEQIKQQYPQKSFLIASLYFRGLHPDCCYVGSFADRFQNPTLYHSAVVLDAYLSGRTEKAAVQSFNIDNFARLGLLSAWDDSLDEMRQRDQHIDLPAADFIERYCREFPGFLTINHPTLTLLHEYIAGALQKLGISFQPMNLAATVDPLADQDIVPVHDFLADYYGLPYRTTQHWMIANLAKKYVSREDFVRRFYSEYRKVPSMKLLINSPMDFVNALKAKDKLSIGDDG